MSFHDKIGTEPAPAQEGEGARKVDRDSLFMAGHLFLEGSTDPIDVRIRNLSAGGLMAEPNTSVANGQAVRIELRNLGLVSGRVAWANDRQFGIAFDSPIDPKIVRRPIGAAEVEKPYTLRKVEHYARPGVNTR
jgi:hypothetical protein